MLVKCPNCAAPARLADGQASMECEHCHTLIRAPAAPELSAPRSGSTGVIVAVVAVLLLVVVGVLVVGGAGAALFLVRSPPPAPPAPVVTPAPVAPAPLPVKAEPPKPYRQVLAFGEEGTGPGQLTQPSHVEAAPDGSYFVADSRSGRVQKFDASGKYVDVITLPPDKLTKQLGVFGLAVDVKGHLYVNRVYDILVYDAATLKLVRTIAGDYPDLSYHGGLSVDPTGAVFALTDRMGDVDLRTIDAKGKLTGKTRVRAKDVAVDGIGTKVLVGNELLVLDAKGETVSKVPGVNGRAIALDGKGHAFVATGSAVAVYDLEGTRLLSLEVGADDLSLDAQRRLVTLSRSAVTVYEVDVPGAPVQ
ncbi:MAG: hypothetical protein JNJ54_15495 [Myxococcaceae bacterium]|nr:hypothetical protein [Myxococcaceae bacterium]